VSTVMRLSVSQSPSARVRMVIKQAPRTEECSTGHLKPTLSYYGNWEHLGDLFQTPGTAHTKQRPVLAKNRITRKKYGKRLPSISAMIHTPMGGVSEARSCPSYGEAPNKARISKRASARAAGYD